MKVISTSFFILFICLSTFAQQAGKKIQYSYFISSVSSEEPLKTLCEKLNSSGKISDCKYRFKASNQSGELVFSFEEKPARSEHDKSNELPDVKELIMSSGLKYEGVATHTLNP